MAQSLRLASLWVGTAEIGGRRDDLLGWALSYGAHLDKGGTVPRMGGGVGGNVGLIVTNAGLTMVRLLLDVSIVTL